MSHITNQDRCMIENMLNAGVTPRAIGKDWDDPIRPFCVKSRNTARKMKQM